MHAYLLCVGGGGRRVHDTIGLRREGLLHTSGVVEVPSDALIRLQIPRLVLQCAINLSSTTTHRYLVYLWILKLF
jgi:hypothetical protein